MVQFARIVKFARILSDSYNKQTLKYFFIVQQILEHYFVFVTVNIELG